MGDSINQDDIDRLLQESMGGGAAPDPAPAAAPVDAPDPEPEPEFEGIANQDDIDALFASVGADPAPEHGHTPVPEPAVPPPPDPVFEGIANQDDIDALFNAVGTASAPAATPPPAVPEVEEDGSASQDDIDALFSAVGGEPEKQEDLDKMIDSGLEDADRESSTETQDLNALLSSIAGGSDDDEAEEPQAEAAPAPAEPEPEPPPAPVPAAPAPAVAPDSAMHTDTADLDMDALLREVESAVPPPPPERLPQSMQPADTAVLDMDLSAALAAAEAGHFGASGPAPAPVPRPQPAAPVPPAAPRIDPAGMQAPLPLLPPVPQGGRREFSVLYGAGEVDSVASQISALLNSMSEKAHSYMQAWIAADSEAKELRARALAEERRRSSLESEKAAVGAQLDELRAKLAELEGGKIASEESRRTLETTSQARIRELESHITLLASESEALKDELTRARNEATGVDIESRRARFEVDRLKNEVESERMERLRIQRALENREKELQAMQAQSSGQASSLFIDELHRLVRRLESELDARASGAHEALKQLDRLETPEAMVPVAANLRAALMQALGRDGEADDALKSLGREASGVKGPAAVAPERTEMVSFETALATYNLDGAVNIAGALLREARATPAVLMRKLYQCPSLRRPEVGDHLPALARLLEGLRTIQEANDHARGSESGEAEVFYVHMFDFLHNLVKLKLINRMSGDMWRIFLDLRGRFSFVNSDRQWAEYRDKTLGAAGV